MKKKRRTNRILSTSEIVDRLLIRLNSQYSPEKTEEDYEEYLKSITVDRNLIDLTLKAWRENLEKGK